MRININENRQIYCNKFTARQRNHKQILIYKHCNAYTNLKLGTCIITEYYRIHISNLCKNSEMTLLPATLFVAYYYYYYNQTQHIFISF